MLNLAALIYSVENNKGKKACQKFLPAIYAQLKTAKFG